jgi:hypothetical protein
MENRIKVLEDESVTVRGELENLKRQMVTMEAKARERESQALLERDEVIRNRMSNGMNLVQDQREAVDGQKVLRDVHWEEKQGRRQAKDSRWKELQDIVRKIQVDVEGVKNQAEEARIERESKPGKRLFPYPKDRHPDLAIGIENVIEEFRRQNVEQREFLNTLSECTHSEYLFLYPSNLPFHSMARRLRSTTSRDYRHCAVHFSGAGSVQRPRRTYSLYLTCVASLTSIIYGSI